jgi:hypothetical protein
MSCATPVNSMNARLRRIIDEVKELPPSERRLVAAELAALEDESERFGLLRGEWDAAWLEEVERRKADYEAGWSRAYSL